MAARARHRDVAPVEGEPCRRMQLHAEQRGRKSMLVVAEDTLAVVTGSELSVVRVVVAVLAPLEAQGSVALCGWTLGRMASAARHLAVHAQQGEGRFVMHAAPERFGQSEPTDALVAMRAVVAELRFVHGCMARHATTSATGCDGAALIVALAALHTAMPATQAEPRVRAALHADLSPACLAVAVGACRAEFATMGILVAVRAGSEVQVAVLGRRAMTSLALDLGVLATQREAREFVIEPIELDALPGAVVVTLLTLLPQTLGVWVFVARTTGTRKPEERPGASTALLPSVTRVATLLGVRALQRVARARVIEGLLRTARPAHEVVIEPAMLHVAVATVLSTILLAVQTALRAELRADVRVAVRATRGIHTTPLRMTIDAMRVALEVFMRPRQFAWRQKLGPRGGRAGEVQHDDETSERQT